MTCHWCGDRHGTDQLCQRAERGMTRRSFCFLFGVGIAGAMLPPKLWPVNATLTIDDIARVFNVPKSMIVSVYGTGFSPTWYPDEHLR